MSSVAEALLKERDAAYAERDLHIRAAELMEQEIEKLQARAERLEAALRLLHENVVLAFPALADLGPVANARAALKGADHE